MKRLLYLFALVAFVVTLNACKKGSDPEPISPVVGKWASDRVRLSGLPAVYASSNGQEFDAFDVLRIRQTYDIKADKTFQLTDRTGGVVNDFPGTWDYTGTELDLKYNDGDQEKLTYDTSKLTAVLLSSTAAVQDTLINPDTKKKELVKFNIQLVYSKP